MAPLHDPIGAIVQHADRSDVDTVIVAGQVVKRGGVLIGVDLRNVLRKAEASAERLKERAEAAATASDS
jgi:cytosine/adenosine deaminase-related metal-dependent hydrolase